MIIHVKEGAVINEINDYYLAMLSSVWKVWNDNKYPGNPVLTDACEGPEGEDTVLVFRTSNLTDAQQIDLMRYTNDELGPDYHCENTHLGLIVSWQPQN